jgi:MoxR-like ATPase
LIGTQIYQPNRGDFSIRLGPVFANIVLADEINRAPPKVQSALLEAMQERQVTIGDQTHALPRPFLVLATQNPIEQEGTYPLPEAQVDRFTLKLRVTYPTLEEELEIIARNSGPPPVLNKVCGPEDLFAAQAVTQQIKVTEVLMRYIVDLVRATREPAKVDKDLARAIEFGASPRASIALTAAARAHAFLDGRGYALPEDVKAVGPDVLRHRVVPTYEAEADGIDGDKIVARILEKVDQR